MALEARASSCSNASRLDRFGMSLQLIATPARLLQSDKSRAPGQAWLSPTELGWNPDLTTLPKMQVALDSIQGSLQRAKGKPMLRFSSSSGIHVLEFASEQDREAFLNLASEVLQQRQAIRAGQVVTQPTGPDSGAKVRLLEQDRALQQLWSQLVQGGVLSDSEFWAGRQSLLHEPQGAVSQKQGFSSSMIASIQPSADGKTQQVKMTLTPQLIQQLFKEEPHIQAAYQANVPGRMEATAFWKKYGEFLVRRASIQKTKRAGTAYSDDDSMFLPVPVKQSQLKDTEGVDPTVNLAADYYDSIQEGYGNLRDSRKESGGAAAAAGEIMSAINRHATAVLEGHGRPGVLAAGSAVGPSAASTSPAQARRMDAALDDLRAHADAAFEALELQDTSRLFPLPRAGGAAQPGRPCQDSARAVHASLAVIKAGNGSSGQPGIDTAQASVVLTDLTLAGLNSPLLAAGRTGSGEAGIPAAALSPGHTRLQQQVFIVNELLRHFWASVPCSLAAREQKAKRMADELQARQCQIAAVLKDTDEQSATLHVAAQPVTQAVHTAVSRFQLEQSKRARAHHGKLLAH